MPNPHPLLVHFPLALLSVGLAFELAAVARQNGDFSRFGWWLQLVGTLGIGIAVLSGLFAKNTVHISPAAMELFEVHEQMAFIVASLFAFLLLWRIGSRGKVPSSYRLLFLLLYGAAVASMFVGAWYGGEMVYRYGVGIR